ncbi:NAD-dependent epimerase/dehydratase family protein [soil metagenome]
MAAINVHSVEDAESLLSEPSPRVIETLAKLEGDLLVLGVAGKMGPTLARMAKRAFESAGVKRKVIGVARFSKPEEQHKLESWGIQTIKADLLDPKQLNSLPDAPNIVYMAGMKFGSTGNEALTWAMNTFLPGMVCQRFAKSRIAAFSTGNVYGLSPLVSGGSIESDTLNPIGDYAMSCVGRERIFEHFSKSQGTPVSIIRLNYACEVRYGVLIDLASKVWCGEPIDLAMGNFNVIWQNDANAMSLMSLAHASSPAFMLNVSGPEILSVRRVCTQFSQMMKKPVEFVGTEAPEALLNNGQLGHRFFGYPAVSAEQMIHLAAEWVMQDGELLNKPTHFEARSGKF